MGKGISEVLTFAVGVAISPAAIIAVILILFSRRARVNGPLFLLGWVVALGVLVAVVYAISDQSNAGTSDTSSDSVSWLKIGLGVSFLLLARRDWRKRPKPGSRAGDAEVDGTRRRAHAGAVARPRSCRWRCEPKEPGPVDRRRRRGLAQLGLSTPDAVVSLIVFVGIGSLSIAGPVIYHHLGGEKGGGRARGAERLARPAQRRGDGGSVPRLRRRPDRERPRAAHQVGDLGLEQLLEPGFTS